MGTSVNLTRPASHVALHVWTIDRMRNAGRLENLRPQPMLNDSWVVHAAGSYPRRRACWLSLARRMSANAAESHPASGRAPQTTNHKPQTTTPPPLPIHPIAWSSLHCLTQFHNFEFPRVLDLTLRVWCASICLVIALAPSARHLNAYCGLKRTNVLSQ